MTNVRTFCARTRSHASRSPAAVISGDSFPHIGYQSSFDDPQEREHIIRVLRACGGVVTTAATRLGLHRTTLNAMMRKLGISRKDL
jgi:formate hydrogenlyase transcriptional activator